MARCRWSARPRPWTSWSTPTATSAAAALDSLTRVYDEEPPRPPARDSRSTARRPGVSPPGWTASAGGRAFQTPPEGHRRHRRRPAGPVARAWRGSATFNGVSPKLSLQYEFADGPAGLRPLSPRASGRAASIPPASSASGPQRTTFEPDRLRNFELGAKGRFLDRRLVLRAAAFYDLWIEHPVRPVPRPRAWPIPPTSATPTSRASRPRPPTTGTSA